MIKYIFLLIMTGCAWQPPERTLINTIYNDRGTTLSQTVTREVGLHLFLGQRKDSQSMGTNSSEIEKAEMGSTMRVIAGAMAGNTIAGLPGAVVGAGAGVIGSKLESDPKEEVDVNTLLAPQIVANMDAAGVAKLKNYINANPEKCQMCGLIGKENVLRLIDLWAGHK